jgi:hypothetical protein
MPPRCVRLLWIAVAGPAILAFPLAATAAPARHDNASSARTQTVPFITVAGGATTHHPRRNRVLLARSLAATEAWRRWLSPHARTALRKVDFDRYGVVVVFRLQKSTGLKITRIELASHTLGLRLTVPKPPPPDPTLVTLGAYHLVAIKRRDLREAERLVVRAVTVE